MHARLLADLLVGPDLLPAQVGNLATDALDVVGHLAERLTIAFLKLLTLDGNLRMCSQASQETEIIRSTLATVR